MNYNFNEAAYFDDLGLSILKFQSNETGSKVVAMNDTDLYISQNNGQSWTLKGPITDLTSSSNMAINDIALSKINDILYILVKNAFSEYLLYKSTNYIDSVIEQITTFPNITNSNQIFMKISENGTEIIVIVPQIIESANYIITLYSNNSGESWITNDYLTESPSANYFITTSASYDLSYIYIIDNNYVLRISTNYGSLWTTIDMSIYIPFIYDICSNAYGNIVYIATGNNGIYKSIDYGNTWIQADFPTGTHTLLNPGAPEGTTRQHYYMTVSCNRIGSSVLVGESDYSNYVYYSIDGGASYYLQSPLVNYNDTDWSQTLVSISSNGKSLLSYSRNNMFYYVITAPEYTFFKSDVSFNYLIKLVSNYSGEKVIGLGSYNIFMSNDYGYSWTDKGSFSSLIDDGITYYLYDIVYSQINDVVIIYTKGGTPFNHHFFKTTNYFTTFTEITPLALAIDDGSILIEISDDGDKIIINCSTTTSYYSADGGSNWTTSTPPVGQFNLITASSNLEYVYFFYGPTYLIYKYTLATNTWTTNGYGDLGNFGLIKCNSDGTILYALTTSALPDTNYLYKSIDSGETWTPLNVPSGLDNLINPGASGQSFTHDYISFTCSKDGNSLLLGETKTSNYVYYSNDGGDNWTLQAPRVNYSDLGGTDTLVNMSGDGNSLFSFVQNNMLYYVINLPCFAAGTKILGINDNYEKQYILIENLEIGDTIITTEGPRKVALIGRKQIYHHNGPRREKNKLYVCRPSAYPEVFQDLIITGCHSILVSKFKSNKQMDEAMRINGDLYITGDKYRLPACVDDRAEIYEKSGAYMIYHIALENENYYYNYGIYANGLLVETCSLRFLYELSKMELKGAL